MTIEKADELVSLVCDQLCHHPYVITDQEELDEKCESCPLVAHLMKDVQESPALIVPDGPLSEEDLAKFRESMKDCSIMAIGEEPSIEFVQQGWIPVSERLPDESYDDTCRSSAVIYDGTCSASALVLVTVIDSHGSKFVSDDITVNGGEWVNFPSPEYEVTHWMPMPEAAKEAEG